MSSANTFVIAGTRSSPIRYEILKELEREPLTVAELASCLGADPEPLWRELDLLRANGLVDAHKGIPDTEYVLTDEGSVAVK